MHNVIYIHGANADSDNFNYYKLKLPEHDSIAPNYDMSEDPLTPSSWPSVMFAVSNAAPSCALEI